MKNTKVSVVTKLGWYRVKIRALMKDENTPDPCRDLLHVISLYTYNQMLYESHSRKSYSEKRKCKVNLQNLLRSINQYSESTRVLVKGSIVYPKLPHFKFST